MPSTLMIASLYRTWRQQARALAAVWRCPQLYEAHARLARRHMDVWPASGSRCAVWERRARKRVRQLMQANAGFPPAVRRAIDEAYGRRGPFRHVLLGALRAPRVTPHKAELRYPPELRVPTVSPALRALLVSQHAHRGSAPRAASLACPPKLHVAIETVERIPGRRVGRRRVVRAHRQWLATQLKRLRAPLCVRVEADEAREDMRAWNDYYAQLYTQLETLARSTPPMRELPRYVAAARAAAVQAQPRQVLRRCVSLGERGRRRMWAAVLASAPVLTLRARDMPAPSARARSAMDAAVEGLGAAARCAVRVAVSPWALYGGKGPRLCRAWATPAEAAYLRHVP